jgi:hypothetical protein
LPELLHLQLHPPCLKTCGLNLNVLYNTYVYDIRWYEPCQSLWPRCSLQNTQVWSLNVSKCL